ncbi:MAG: galactokinase family protein [Candidatus Coproplasma sp.]
MNEREYEYKATAACRVNIIGERVDYCVGKVLPAALSL